MKVRIRWNSRHSENPARPPAGENIRINEPSIIGRLMVQAFGASDSGCIRNNNEDYFLIEPSLGLYLVADGMGGALAGEHASKLAAETVREVIAAQPARDAETLVAAFEEANRRVMLQASSDPSMQGMGTTLVAALEVGEELWIASVGDSRVYFFEGGKLRVITEDQTWVNEVGRHLGIDEESLKSHPMRHVLTMAIGVSEDLRIHTYPLKTSSGNEILLCSDGLHGVVSEQQLAKTMARPSTLESKCDELIAAAKDLGGPDNITAVLLRAA